MANVAIAGVKRNAWHIRSEPGRYTLSRHWPPRFDFCVEAEFPLLRAGRLAQQVRQDMWRTLRDLRGFSPVVDVIQSDNSCIVKAGGRVAPPLPSTATSRLAALLSDPSKRTRWIDWAREAAHDH